MGFTTLFPSLSITFIITSIGDDFFGLQAKQNEWNRSMESGNMGVSQYTNNKPNCAVGKSGHSGKIGIVIESAAVFAHRSYSNTLRVKKK